VPIRIALVPALALLAVVPAEAARDVVVRDSPRSEAATCLRPAGPPGMVGLIGAVRSRMSPYELLRVSATGVTVAGTARLGILDQCPAVAAAPNGHAIVAAGVWGHRSRGVIRAALAEPGRDFGPPEDIAGSRHAPVSLAAAVSPRGDAVVAWTLARPVRGERRADARTRVVAALRPAGGDFGPPRFLTPWRRGSFFPFAAVSAGMDAYGTATVAWSQPIPDRRDISGLRRVEVATAGPGERFGQAQTVAAQVQDTERVALAVQADGRALLAHDGRDTIDLYERGPGTSSFERVDATPGRTPRPGWESPELALAPDGSAVLAWRGNADAGNEDVFLSSRSGSGPWTAPARLQRSRDRGGPDAIGFVVYTRFGESPPTDFDGGGLRVAMSDAGGYLVSWTRARRTAVGDLLLEARMVRGEAGGTASRPQAAGCRCRAVEGVVPLAVPGGDPVLAYTDNVTTMLAFGLELPRESGRLHVATPGRPGAGPAPPRVIVRRPHDATLGEEDRLRVRVGCDGPCDLRAYVVGGSGRARGLGTATLRRAGSTPLAIRPPFERHLAPPGGGRARVVVHGFAPNGARFTRRSVAVELGRERARRPLRPGARRPGISR
jgi:hypothetical protein